MTNPAFYTNRVMQGTSAFTTKCKTKPEPPNLQSGFHGKRTHDFFPKTLVSRGKKYINFLFMLQQKPSASFHFFTQKNIFYVRCGNLFTITSRINRGLSLVGPQITIDFILKLYLYLTTWDRGFLWHTILIIKYNNIILLRTHGPYHKHKSTKSG